MINVAINGFGRIGRGLTRLITAREMGLKIVAINDPLPGENLAYLLRNDTIFGVLDGLTAVFADGFLEISRGQKILQKIRVFSRPDPENLVFGEKISVIFECSGKVCEEKLPKFLGNGALRVITAWFLDPCFIFGANDSHYHHEKILSAGSCTMNALGPVCKILHENFGILRGNFTSIHSVTSVQSVVDSGNTEFRKGRSALQNIIPISSVAGQNLGSVLPFLRGKISGYSARVPTTNGTLLDLNLILHEPTTREKILQILQNFAKNFPQILKIDEDFGVSSDFLGATQSAIVASDLLMCDENLTKIHLWHDNELGFCARLIDLAKLCADGVA